MHSHSHAHLLSIELFILGVAALACLWWYSIYQPDQLQNQRASSNAILEGFQSSDGKDDVSNTRCPNLLIQKGAQFYLYNSKLAKIPGVNPIVFDSLENYSEFLTWQRSAGIRCPVLYAQYTYDINGEPVYRIRPDPMDLQGGNPSSTPSMFAHNRPTFAMMAAEPNVDAALPPADTEVNENAGGSGDASLV